MRNSIIAMAVFLAACQTDKQTDDRQISNLQAIKHILETERRAHFEKSVDLLLSTGAEPFVSVDRGSVSYPSAEKSRERFQNYFNSVDFIKWDDMRDPIFNFSNDSSLAVVTVQKLVILREKATDKIDTTQFAWTAVYRKMNDEWKMTVMTSTNR